jgi:hypothetical protein
VSPLVTSTGPEDLAHLVHYGIVAAGLAGVAALVLPGFLERAHPSGPSGEPADDHQRRVSELRERVESGTLARPAPPSVASGSREAGEDGEVGRAGRVQDSPDVLVPVVAISSVAAAGAHAAVAPPHLSTSLLVGSFFVVCAAAQLVWAALVWRRRTPWVLGAGIVGNLVVLALWLVSRTVGVPGLDGPEPVGPWDLTCALWEVVLVVGCVRLWRNPSADRHALGGPVHPLVVFWLVLSVLALGLLSLSGAAA